MKPWTYDPSPSIHLSISEQLTVFPREQDMTVTALRLLWLGAIRVWLRMYFRLSIVGRDRLPTANSFVLVSNHSSHLDALCLASILPLRSVNRFFAAAAKDYFFHTFWSSLLTVVCFNAIPFDRLHDKRKSLELCADVLNASDHVLIMFPEGTRSLAGVLQPFKKGIGILVAGTNRMVVPTWIDGAYQAWPKGARWPRPRRIRICIGQPMVFSHAPRTEEGFGIVATAVEAAVRKLSEAKGDHGILRDQTSLS